MIDENEILAT